MLRLAVRTLCKQVAVAGIAPSGASRWPGGLPRLVRKRNDDSRVSCLTRNRGGRERWRCNAVFSTHADNHQAQEAGVHNGAHYGYGPRAVDTCASLDVLSVAI